MPAPDLSSWKSEGFLPAPEIARALKCDPSTFLRRLYRYKEIDRAKAGPYWLVNVGSFLDHLRQRTSPMVFARVESDLRAALGEEDPPADQG